MTLRIRQRNLVNGVHFKERRIGVLRPLRILRHQSFTDRAGVHRRPP